MKIFVIIFFYFFIQSSIQGCDCDFIYRSTNYLKYEVVFIAILTQDYRYEYEDSKYKWKTKILKTIKGEPLDTLFTGDFCGIKYNKGDTVIIYGFNDLHKNWTRTGNCFGNRIIGSEKWRNISSYNLYRKIGGIEISLLNLYQEKIGNIQYKKLPELIRIPKTEIKNINISREIYKIRNMEDIKIVYVKLDLSREGEIMRIDYLNKVSMKIKESINEFLKNNKWKIPSMLKDEKVSIIESFVYNN